MKILEEFYYGNIRASDRPSAYREEREEVDRLARRNYDKLLALLNDEQKDRFRRLEDCIMEQGSIDERYAFLAGFRLGVRMMAECFADEP